MKKSSLLGIIIGAVGVYFGYRALEEVDKLRNELNQNNEDDTEDDNMDWDGVDFPDDEYNKGRDGAESKGSIDIMVPRDSQETEENSDETEEIEKETEEIEKETEENSDKTEENKSTITITEDIQ